jgi:hypothetical protein
MLWYIPHEKLKQSTIFTAHCRPSSDAIHNRCHHLKQLYSESMRSSPLTLQPQQLTLPFLRIGSYAGRS